MVDYITSNPALPGIQAAQNREIELAQMQRQQAEKARQDETQRGLASFYAGPSEGAQTPTQQALAFAVKQPGAGGEAMQLASARAQEQAAQSKTQGAHEDKAMELLLGGDLQGAAAYAQAHNTTSVLSLLEHPTLAQEVVNFGQLADKVRPKDLPYKFAFVQAGMAELPKILGSVNPATNRPFTYQEALRVAQTAAMETTKNTPLPQPGAARMVQDSEGNFLWSSPNNSAPIPANIKGPKPIPKSPGGGGKPTQKELLYNMFRQDGLSHHDALARITGATPMSNDAKNVFAYRQAIELHKNDLGGSPPPEVIQADATRIRQELDSMSPPSPQATTRRYVPGKGFVPIP